VEISELRSAGLTTVDLHWLVTKGYVMHAVEETRPESQQRLFGRIGELSFAEKSCFVLTKTGARLVRRLERTASAQAGEIPFYDIGRHQLWLGNELVKEFKQLAPEQEKILKEFQRRGWPARILNPLTSKPEEQHAKIHLGQVIRRLNGRQRNALIRFHADGTGQGITWEIVRPS
jgi:hypothetical protein